jgi:antitoxin component YwqK of YwqJK toxin-antitoxin module
LEGNYVKGKFHGLGTEWDEGGNVISQTNFENGKEVEEVK